MTLPPKGTNDNRGGMFAGDSQAITKDSKQPDAAFELLKWLTDQETGVQLGLQTKGSSTLGGRPDVYADPRIVNEAIFPKEAQQAQLQSVQVLKGPYSAAYNYRASGHLCSTRQGDAARAGWQNPAGHGIPGRLEPASAGHPGPAATRRRSNGAPSASVSP